jgi:hypothetical protein
MSVTAMMTGARLAYVVRPIEGEVSRDKYIIEARKSGRDKQGNPTYTHEMKKITKKEPAGFMVYFPRGHALRLRSVEDLKQYNLDQPPQVVNLDGIHDRNSPAGQLMHAQTDEARRGAFTSLENQVIALATAKSGPVLMPEQTQRAA